MNPEELIKQCVEALMNTPEFAFIRDLMEKSKGEAEDEPEAYSEEEKAKMEDEADEKAKMEEEEKLKEEEEEDEAPAKLRMQRDQGRRKYAKLESHYKALAGKVEALEKDKRVAERTADLLALEGEGYDIDLHDELGYVSDMEPARYSKHITKIRKSYRKAPVGVNITPARVNAEGGVTPAVASPKDVYAKVAASYKAGKTLSNRPEEGN